MRDRQEALPWNWKAFARQPFETLVTFSSMLPAILVLLDYLTDVPNTTLEVLEPPFDGLLALICLLGGLLVGRGVLHDLLRPVVLGLRISAMGWLPYCLLVIALMPGPNSVMMSVIGLISVTLSLGYAQVLGRRLATLERAAHRGSE